MSEKPIHPVDVILHKRDGLALTDAEIQYFVRAVVERTATDAQIASWLMAVWQRGLTARELATLTTAITEAQDSRLQFTRADATALPFADGSFDFVLTGMFLHHLDEPAAIKVLQEMDRVANHAVIAADLIRSRRAYFWITLFTLLANPMVKHDARVSVAGAFSRDELISLCGKAGLDYLKPHRHFGHRLVLAGLCAASGKSGLPTIPS